VYRAQQKVLWLQKVHFYISTFVVKMATFGKPEIVTVDFKMTKKLKLTFIYLLILFESCTVPLDARILKRTTKEWRDSKIVLYGWSDTPFSGIFLTLRNNGKFEHTSSGLIQSFEAGTWTNSQDTIRLAYIGRKQNSIRNQKVTIDRQTSTLVFEGDSTPVQMRLRIMTNEIR